MDNKNEKAITQALASLRIDCITVRPEAVQRVYKKRHSLSRYPSSILTLRRGGNKNGINKL